MNELSVRWVSYMLTIDKKTLLKSAQIYLKFFRRFIRVDQIWHIRDEAIVQIADERKCAKTLVFPGKVMASFLGLSWCDTPRLLEKQQEKHHRLTLHYKCRVAIQVIYPHLVKKKVFLHHDIKCLYPRLRLLLQNYITTPYTAIICYSQTWKNNSLEEIDFK